MMSWADDYYYKGSMAPRVTSESINPKAELVSSREAELTRKILNLEATVTNLKHTILNVLQELEAMRVKTGVSKFETIEDIIKKPLEKVFQTSILPEINSKIEAFDNSLKTLQSKIETKSPFDVKVLDY